MKTQLKTVYWSLCLVLASFNIHEAQLHNFVENVYTIEEAGGARLSLDAPLLMVACVQADDIKVNVESIKEEIYMLKITLAEGR